MIDSCSCCQLVLSAHADLFIVTVTHAAISFSLPPRFTRCRR